MARQTRYAIWYSNPFIGIGNKGEPPRRQMHPAFQNTARTTRKSIWARKKTPRRKGWF